MLMLPLAGFQLIYPTSESLLKGSEKGGQGRNIGFPERWWCSTARTGPRLGAIHHGEKPHRVNWNSSLLFWLVNSSTGGAPVPVLGTVNWIMPRNWNGIISIYISSNEPRIRVSGGFRLCRDTLWVFGIFGTGDRDPHGIVLNRLRRDNERRISALRCNNIYSY